MPDKQCFFTDKKCEAIMQALSQLNGQVATGGLLSKEASDSSKAVAQVLDNKMDTLINTIVSLSSENSKKNVLPVSVIGWVVLFMIVFALAFIFGVEGAEKLFGGKIRAEEVSSTNTE